MDGLLRNFPSVDQNNNTRNASPEFSPNVLNTLLPGYSIISHYAQVFLGIDISILVTTGVIILAITKGGMYLFDQIEATFRYLFMSSVYIEDGDDIFDMLMTWLDARNSTTNHRNLRAKTPRGSQADDDEEADAIATSPSETLSASGLFDYKKWSARTPPRYEPYYGRHIFWHGGQPFILKRSRRPPQQSVQINWSRTQASDDYLQIDCLGRSTLPIQKLLHDVKIASIERKRHITTIRHPSIGGRYGGSWYKTASRTSRPLSTVILAAEQKTAIIEDMNEFLHPSSAGWYARRGIPYRRGYLFHGPPGTGKTSLSFALAGLFGLDVHALSLQEPTLTEADLMSLFNALPRRCVVLLEDVDAAGLVREEGEEGKEKEGEKKKAAKKHRGEQNGDGQDKKKTEGEKADGKDGDSSEKGKAAASTAAESYTLADLAKELKTLTTAAQNTQRPAARARNGRRGPVAPAPGTGMPGEKVGTGISLSGLLNAIDGVASHEGRVLIMTTNHPDKLDAALVRPGRVDRKVGFNLAMREEVKELFVRMYRVDDEGDDSAEGFTSSGKLANGGQKATNGSAKHEAQKHETNGAVVYGDLDGLAERFASFIPDDTFTPAEIQNHLMRYKNSPRVAVETVQEWRDGLLEEKEKKRRKEEGLDDEDEEDDEESR